MLVIPDVAIICTMMRWMSLYQHKTEQREAYATHHSDKDFVTHSCVTTCSSPHLSNLR